MLWNLIYWGLFGIVTIPFAIVMMIIGVGTSGPKLSKDEEETNNEEAN